MFVLLLELEKLTHVRSEIVASLKCLEFLPPASSSQAFTSEVRN